MPTNRRRATRAPTGRSGLTKYEIDAIRRGNLIAQPVAVRVDDRRCFELWHRHGADLRRQPGDWSAPAKLWGEPIGADSDIQGAWRALEAKHEAERYPPQRAR